MTRNLSDLLPARFDDLTLDSVAKILRSLGEERETLFFERKLEVTPQTLAKTCAAFANTLGGLLIVGIDDSDDLLVGIESPANEPQLWVKDTLRGHVLPLPPFRARWLPTESGRGVLLVLVEESSVTPHLLTRSGAIYVRNPGSSDPVPLADQGRLLELARRGRQTEAAAREAATEALIRLDLDRDGEPAPIDTLVIAATGVTTSFEDNRGADFVGVSRRYSRRFDSPVSEGIGVDRRGAAWTYWSAVGEDPRWGAVEVEHLRTRFERSIRTCRQLLGELGAHGRAWLVYRILQGDRPMLAHHRRLDVDPHAPIIVSRWTTFDDEDIGERVFSEVQRAGGLAPPEQA